MGKFEDAVRAAKAGEKEVDVRGTELSEKQVQELANAIAEGGRVEILNAWGCGITDQGATALAAGIQKCPQLQGLGLDYNKITKSGRHGAGGRDSKMPEPHIGGVRRQPNDRRG